MKIVRQGSVGTPFLVHTGFDLTTPDALKLRFYRPDLTFAFEVEDGGDPEDVAAVGSPTIGDLGWTDTDGSFPIDTPADCGIWSIVAVVERDGQVRPSGNTGKFRVVAWDDPSQ